MASCLHAYLNYNPDAGFQDGMIALLAPLVNCIKSEEEMFWCYNGLMQRIGLLFTFVVCFFIIRHHNKKQRIL